MRVVVEPYNPAWATQFIAIKYELEGILYSANASYKSIEHVGSTSVPGLAAKPHIDVDIVVSEDQVQPTLAACERSGLYKSIGELGIYGRHAMHYLTNTDNLCVPGRSVSVCIEGCQALRNHLALREMCISYPAIRDEYSRVKQELSQQEWGDVNDYCVAKNDVIAWILTEAGMGAEVDAIKDINIRARDSSKNANKTVKSETSSF